MQNDESLLSAFFREELGSELPPLPRHDSDRRTRRGKLAPAVTRLLIAGVAALVFLSVWLGWPRGQEDDSHWTSDLVVIEDSGVTEQVSYETGGRAVEQKTHLNCTKVVHYDMESGDRIVWSVPELTIVVEPVKNERKR